MVADLFLRLDPLASLGTIVATRTLASALIPGLLTLGLTLVIGRFFCGHVCPLGTTLDLLERAVLGRRRPTAGNNKYRERE